MKINEDTEMNRNASKTVKDIKIDQNNYIIEYWLLSIAKIQKPIYMKHKSKAHDACVKSSKPCKKSVLPWIYMLSMLNR